MRRIVLELTNRCNLACGHCHEGRHGGRDDLPVQLVRRVLASARDEGFRAVSLTGGEPTLHPEFRGILRECAVAGYRFGIVTNGWNFDRAYRDLLECREALDVVTFSLDGAAEATHDRLRGHGSQRRVLRAMSVCVALDLPFNVNTVLTRDNRDELEDLVRLATQIGSRGIRFGHLMPTPRTTRTGLDLSPAQRKEVEARIREIGRNAQIAVAMAPGHHTARPFPCGVLRGEEINVDCRGNLTKCCHLSSQGSASGDRDRVGSLRDQGFAEAYGRWQAENAVFRAAKRRRGAAGRMRDIELFPCWYCSLYYEKVDWMKDAPDRGWGTSVRRLLSIEEGSA